MNNINIIPENALYFKTNKALIKALDLRQIPWLYAYLDFEHFRYGYKHICIVDQSSISLRKIEC